ncbi:MAG: DEAD/DEAH box helicase, partial [Longimicrobiales bacterium]|nr:DEAD/DEAH box helicase [Longimicrobiales bacterium]
GMGTGKTRCALEVARRTKAQRILVLCPLSVVPAWQSQIELFTPEVAAVPLLKGTVRKKHEHAKAKMLEAHVRLQPCAIIVNYESARSAPLGDWLREQQFDLLVLDESHRIKSPGGTTSRWVSRLAQTCKRRLALTGTPMPHSPLDVYGQFRALAPTLFGWSFVRFRRQYAQMGGFQGKQVTGYQRIEELQRKLADFTYQADRSVLDLPDALHEQRVVELTPKARKLYEDLDRDFAAQVEAGEITAANALVKLLRLQQLTSGRVTVEQGDDLILHQVDTAKQDALRDLLEDLPADEPVVVFGRFSSDLTAVHEAAKATGRASLELSGKRRELEAWQAGEAPVLAVQIQSGGTGIDLTRARYCCYLSTGFSLGDYEQSLARVHRPGQSRPVVYYHFVARNTIDEKVYGALRQRKQVVEAVLDGISNPTPTL